MGPMDQWEIQLEENPVTNKSIAKQEQGRL